MKSSSRPLLVALLCAVAVLAAASYLFWFWRSWSRPGVVHYLKGMDFLVAHQPQEAEREWIAGIKEDPASYQCYEQLGNLYSALQRNLDAATAFRAAASRNPSDGTLYIRLSSTERKLSEDKLAAVDAARACALLPANADAQGEYGLAEAKLNNRPVALSALRRAHALKPQDDLYTMAMITTEMDTNDLSGAEQDLTQYLKTHSRDSEAYYLMAALFHQKPSTPTNLATSLQLARRAFILKPSDVRVLTLIGQLYLEMDRPANALPVLLAASRVYPNRESILHALVDCYGRLSRVREQAEIAARLQKVIARHDRIEHLKDVTGFNHYDTTAGLELARLEEDDGELDQALKYYSQLVRQAPNDPRTRPALAGFYQRRHRSDMAQAVMSPEFLK